MRNFRSIVETLVGPETLTFWRHARMQRLERFQPQASKKFDRQRIEVPLLRHR